MIKENLLWFLLSILEEAGGVDGSWEEVRDRNSISGNSQIIDKNTWEKTNKQNNIKINKTWEIRHKINK